jgi:hypothetical protein
VARRKDDQRKQKRAPLEALVLPGLSAQRSAPPASRARLQHRELPALALPKEIERWSLTTLRDKPAKVDTCVVRHGRYVVFQLAEVAVRRVLLAKIVPLIDGLWLRSAPFPA